MCMWLQQKGCALDVGNADGFHPVHYASYAGQLAVVEWLHGQCVDLNVSSKSGLTPMHAACHEGHVDVATFLYARAEVAAAFPNRKARGSASLFPKKTISRERQAAMRAWLEQDDKVSRRRA